MKKILEHVCPKCGSPFFVTNKGYHCSKCTLHIPGYICNRHISATEAEQILAGNRIILDGFYSESKNGFNVFSSIPVITGDTVKLDNTIFLCHNKEMGGTGRVIVGRHFFKCERSFNCTCSCYFARRNLIRRSIDGHMLTVDDIYRLITDKAIQIETLSDKGDILYREIGNAEYNINLLIH